MQQILRNQGNHRDSRTYLKKIKDFAEKHEDYVNFLLEHWSKKQSDHEEMHDYKKGLRNHLGLLQKEDTDKYKLSEDENNFAETVLDLISNG